MPPVRRNHPLQAVVDSGGEEHHGHAEHLGDVRHVDRRVEEVGREDGVGKEIDDVVDRLTVDAGQHLPDAGQAGERPVNTVDNEGGEHPEHGGAVVPLNGGQQTQEAGQEAGSGEEVDEKGEEFGHGSRGRVVAKDNGPERSVRDTRP